LIDRSKLKKNWKAKLNEWDALFEKAKKNGDIYDISYYASFNNKEFFAESFVM